MHPDLLARGLNSVLTATAAATTTRTIMTCIPKWHVKETTNNNINNNINNTNIHITKQRRVSTCEASNTDWPSRTVEP